MTKDYDIFISHSSDDALSARFLRGYMRSHNLNCWLDDHEIRLSERADDDSISQRIEDAIRRSRYLLVVLSSNAMESKWVRQEVEHARMLNRQDEDNIELVAVCVEEKEPNTDEKPEWLKDIRIVQIGGIMGKVDRLQDLRDQIGEPKPTYMSSVEPSFVKQTPVSRLTDHLRKCDFDEIKLWFINGGFTIRTYIRPAVSSALEKKLESRNAVEKVHAKVMFVDSANLDENEIPENLNSAEKQKDFDERLRHSGYFTRAGDHHDLVLDAIDTFRKIDEKFDNFTAEFRLTHKIPAGRMVIAGRYGFFSPFIQEFDADLPVMIFDDKSPFFKTADRYFDEVFDEARVYYPANVPKTT